jgi:hypothetical protein
MPPTATADTTEAQSGNAHVAVHGAGAMAADAIDAIRSTAGGVGERLPQVIDAVRVGASESTRTVQSWPQPAQRLLAAFSLGLGVGLTLGGAPRLLVTGALLPALAVAAVTASQDVSRVPSRG